MLSQQHFSSREQLTMTLADDIAERLSAAIAEHGLAALAVSGGRTPVDLFERLSAKSIEWSKVMITLIDERWVGATQEASNERLVRTHLLKGKAAAAEFIALKSHHSSAYDAVDEVNVALSRLPAQLTVSILGMGEDAHTASFFPGADTLEQCLHPDPYRSCCATTPVNAPFDRMTLTLPRILASEWIVLHLTGESKLPVLQSALEPGAIDDKPVRSVLHQSRTPISVYFAS